MGLSASFALKMAADSAFKRGDVEEGKRLMKQYNEAMARAKREQLMRKQRELEQERKREMERKMERERKKIK